MQATVDTFIQFLKENNVYRTFRDHLSKLRSLTIEEYWETLEDANNAIYGAFHFTDVPETTVFWSELSRKWENKIKSNKEKIIEYIPIWKEKAICKVHCPGRTSKQEHQIEKQLRKMHPEIVSFEYNKDYIYGITAELDRLTEKL